MTKVKDFWVYLVLMDSSYKVILFLKLTLKGHANGKTRSEPFIKLLHGRKFCRAIMH